jgi:two-component sensor histidine kinase/PAS domain-containing protein
LSDAFKRERALRVIFAVGDDEEGSAFSSAMAAAAPGCELFFPSSIAEVEALYSSDRADAIVTDFRFHGGALADWLTFWPLPTILLVDPSDDLDRVGRTVRDEAALFVQRMPAFGHVRVLPLLIRKALNLRESTARQNAHLQMSEHQYLNLLQAVPDIVYTLDSKGKFIYLNEAVRSLGYEPASLIGRHFSVLVHPEDVPRVSRDEAVPPLLGTTTGEGRAPKLFDERRSGKRMTRNLEVRLRLGDLVEDYKLASVTSYGEINCSGFALPEFEGSELGTVGIIRDVTVRKGHDLALEAALASREVLLKEIHHRVKNNLQVVSSLLNIQEPGIVDEASRKVFVECQTQIQTMAMVHEVLYRSSSMAGVEMRPYFELLVDYLSSVYDGEYKGVSCAAEAEGVTLDLDDAIPVALIVNELVSNCLKHAFPEGRKGRIRVSMREEGEDWVLEVEDDGVGIAGQGSSAPRSEAKEPGIGTELVQALSGQLRGALSRGPGAVSSSGSPSSGPGTLVTMRFPRLRSRPSASGRP